MKLCGSLKKDILSNMLRIIQKITLYVFLLVLFAVPNYFFIVRTSAYAMCPCIENVITDLLILYGPISFGLLAVIVTWLLNKKFSLLKSITISFLICFITFTGTRVLLTKSADSIGELFPSLQPEGVPVPSQN